MKNLSLDDASLSVIHVKKFNENMKSHSHVSNSRSLAQKNCV